MSKEDITRQRKTAAAKRSQSLSDGWITVAVLRAVLQITHSLTVGWAWTGAWLLGYIIGDLIYLGIKSALRGGGK